MCCMIWFIKVDSHKLRPMNIKYILGPYIIHYEDIKIYTCREILSYTDKSADEQTDRKKETDLV